MLNRIILMGRLTRDPELRHTQQGTSVASFSLAVDRPGREKATDFIDCVAWRNTADFVSSYFTKGRMAVVEGRLQIREWTDRDGGKRRSAEVVADDVYFGDSKPTGDSQPRTNTNTYSAPASAGYGMPSGDQFAELADDDSDLPF